MSKKTNPLNLRSIKNKVWVSRSFFEKYNYSKLLYQDLYIQNYIKNIFQYNIRGSLINNISIQRKRENINIFLDYYRVKIFSKKRWNKKLFLIKKRLRWRKARSICLAYMRLRKKGRSRYQKYTRRILKVKKRTHGVIIYDKEVLGQENSLPIFSFKRLIILNLTSLTGCHINLYTRNIAHLSRLPIFTRDKSKFRYKINTVKKIMYKLRIQSRIHRLKGLDVSILVHLFYTSFIFKSPGLLGAYIGRIIKRNIRFFFFFFFFFRRVLAGVFFFSKLSGLKVQFKGRLGTSLRKKKFIVRFGSMPLQTINSIIKYSFTESLTLYGICGIKIWYYY
jgi:hypothetical protein